MKSSPSTQQFIDIENIEEDVVILKNSGLRQIVMVSGINLDLVSEEERNTTLHLYQNFLNSLDFPTQFLIHSRKFNIENYKKDLKATGISARGWVWTGFNYREGRLVNYLGDSQNTYSMWGVEPLVALDTYEHAYFIDYGVNRGSYIDAFFENLDWKKVEENFDKCCECECEAC